jgi:hypothetical protein
MFGADLSCKADHPYRVVCQLVTKCTVVGQVKELRWVGACDSVVGEKRTQGFGGETEGKIQLEDLGIDGRVLLKWILKEQDERHGVD